MRAAERAGFSGPALIDAVVATARRTIGPALVGVYLHGSWCLGGFDPRVSDLDYVMVVQHGLTQAQKRALMAATMQDVWPLAPVKGLEFHVLTADAARDFHHPCRFDLHFSPLHEAAYRRDPAAFVAGMHGTDPDLAAHLTVLRSAGQCAWGQAIAATFGPVPVADYWASVMGDVGDAPAAIAGAPVYTTLNLCRTLAFARTGSVMGKTAGGAWAAVSLPQWQDVVAAALAGYRGQTVPPVARGRLVAFAEFALARLAAGPGQNRSRD
ncbi:aminoglycoside adenylyltransferase domain-containing protein [Lacticaseibacillus kribbianus]|uniref:aminoglycoside adenylyltransferase domain-containing protein n=1 Tax=Lacticaseibacillus kribbianus TaxID=2926292 RepID=UPI001CD7C309|nr:aminoglycoside adenylyltransferase domain-containing protein [Lacticaseibacillus kribbianus]